MRNLTSVISLSLVISVLGSSTALATPKTEATALSGSQSSVNATVVNQASQQVTSVSGGGNASVGVRANGGSATSNSTGGNATTGSSSAQLSGINMSPRVNIREASQFPVLPVAPISYNSFGSGVSCAVASVYGNAFVRETGYSATEFGAVVGFSTPLSKKEDDENCSKLGKLQRQRLEQQVRLESLQLQLVESQIRNLTK